MVGKLTIREDVVKLHWSEAVKNGHNMTYEEYLKLIELNYTVLYGE